MAEKKSEKSEAINPSKTSKEVEELIVTLGNQDKTPEQIGLILRDQHAVPNVKVLTGKSISAIMKKAGIAVKTQEKIIEARLKKLEEHLAKNKNDKGSKRAITQSIWALHNLAKAH